MDAAAEIGRKTASKHQVQPEYGDEQADAGRVPNPFHEAKFSGAYGDREIFIFPVQLTTSRIDNLIRLIHVLVIRVTIHGPTDGPQNTICKVRVLRHTPPKLLRHPYPRNRHILKRIISLSLFLSFRLLILIQTVVLFHYFAFYVLCSWGQATFQGFQERVATIFPSRSDVEFPAPVQFQLSAGPVSCGFVR